MTPLQHIQAAENILRTGDAHPGSGPFYGLLHVFLALAKADPVIMTEQPEDISPVRAPEWFMNAVRQAVDELLDATAETAGE